MFERSDALSELSSRVAIFAGWLVQRGSTLVANADFLRSVAIVLAALILIACASYTLATKRKDALSLLGLELITIELPTLAWCLPTASMRITFGLNFCVYGLGIHAGVCSLLQNDGNQSVKAARMTSVEAFVHEMGNILYVNVFRRVKPVGHSRLPQWDTIARMLTAFAVCDTCIYLIREWLPIEGNMGVESRYYVESLLLGIYVLAAMECLQGFWTVQLGLLGAELPPELHHRHPLLSQSLAEFWGARWNPIAAKLLQDSFYKPLRRLGASRAVSVMACFAGSAILHALPVYLANQNPTDTWMMAAFFLLQGLCVLSERAVGNHFLLGRYRPQRHDQRAALSSSSEGQPFASASFETAIEALLVMSVLAGACFFLELRPRPDRHPLAMRIQCATTAALSYGAAAALHAALYRGQRTVVEKDHPSAPPPRSFSALAAAFLGWTWTLSSLLLLLPLFSQPLLRATQEPHSRSCLVGPLLRAYFSS